MYTLSKVFAIDKKLSEVINPIWDIINSLYGVLFVRSMMMFVRFECKVYMDIITEISNAALSAIDMLSSLITPVSRYCDAKNNGKKYFQEFKIICALLKFPCRRW